MHAPAPPRPFFSPSLLDGDSGSPSIALGPVSTQLACSVPSSATAGRACEIISAESLILHMGHLRFKKGKDLPQFTIVPFRGKKGTSILILRLPETLATSWLLPNTSWLRYSTPTGRTPCLYTSVTARNAPSEDSHTCIFVNTLARDCA